MKNRNTLVAIDGESWLANGRLLNAGRVFRGVSIEGLLLNSRMVQAVFDDENPVTSRFWAYPDTGAWDPERNTREFIEAMPVWKAHGLNGLTINLQGGSPLGYYKEDAVRHRLAELGVKASDSEIWRGVPSPVSQPWISTGIDELGALKPAYRARLEMVLDRADELGFVVILGIFYQGQDERMRDEAAIKLAVDNVCRWVLENGYSNVVIEINNECSVPTYEHEILKPARVSELILRARSHSIGGRRLLAGTSYGGRRVPDPEVVEASDFVLIHGNGVTDPNRISEMVDQTRALPAYNGTPIVFNEDDHYDFDKPLNNFTAALARRAGWGFFDPGSGAGGGAAFGNYNDGYQNPPINWGINTPRKRAFFELLKQVTGS